MKSKSIFYFTLHSLFMIIFRFDNKITMINDINNMMLGSKAPNYDTYGLLRAMHFHNPTRYSHIVGYSSHFYAHIGAGPKVLHPPMSKLMWA